MARGGCVHRRPLSLARRRSERSASDDCGGSFRCIPSGSARDGCKHPEAGMSTVQPIALSGVGGGWIAHPCPSAEESAGTRHVSLTAAAVGFLFSFRAVLVLISARWLSWGTEPGVIAGIVAEIILLLMATLQACGPQARSIGWIFRLPCVRWVLCFLAFSCCSLVWSGTASRLASSMYWGAMAADVAIVLMLLLNRAVMEVAHSIMKGYVVASVVLAAVAWLIPAEWDLRLGDLEYFNTNQIANICAMGVFLAQFLASRKDGRWRVSMVLLTLTLVRSMSKEIGRAHV